MKRPEYFIFAIVLVLAALLRGHELWSQNYLFLLDQGRDMMEVKKIVYDHHLTLIGPRSSLSGVFQGPFWYYLLVVPTILLNGNPIGTIILMFVISMAAIFVMFFWTKKLFGVKTALISSFLLALSSEAIAAATFSWNPHPMWLLITIFIFSFYEVVSGNRRYNLVVWPAIALMFHFETALAVFILVSSILYILIFKRVAIRSKHFIVGMLLAGVLFLPQIIFDLRHNFLMSRSIFSFSTGKQGVYTNGHWTYIDAVKNHIFAFNINFESAFVHFSIIEDYFLAFFLFLAAIFFSINRGNKTREFAKMSCRLLIFVFLLTLLYPFPIPSWFLTGFQVFYIVLAGIFLSKVWNSYPGRIFCVCTLFVFSYLSVARVADLYTKPADYGGALKIKGKLDAIDFVYHDANGKKFNALIFTPPVYTYPYDYLLWWRAKQRYHYLPGKEKKGTFYLIMEVDPSKPWTYNGWIETVIKSGRIIYTKELKSGIIIQKRQEV